MQLIPNEGDLPAGTVKVGLLPGSFNLPHAGHIDLALRAREAGLDRVLFYANSFNLAKWQTLAPIARRRDLLGPMIDPSFMSVLPAAFYPDAPAEALIGGEYSFAPLIERLRGHFPARYEIWMLRGGDYFTTSDGRAAAYPPELRHLPHVVGTRGLDPGDLDLTILERCICIETLRRSSTDLRGRSGLNHDSHGTSGRNLDDADGRSSGQEHAASNEPRGGSLPPGRGVLAE